MKVLFISNYRDFSGWGDAAYNKILSMHSANIDLCIRPIYFSQNKRQCELLDELESKSYNKYDYVIQYTLPHYYSYNGPAINIGNYECETTFKTSLWQKHINMMDYAWVSSSSSRDQSILSDVYKKISVIPNSVNIDYYKNHNIEAEIEGIDKDSYNFYYVGELSKRKNVSTLLRAFYTTFGPKENVNLILKLNKPGYSSGEVFKKFQELDEKIRYGMKIGSKHKKVICLTDYLPRDNLTAIVKNLNCFVTASYGEGWCYDALYAVAMGQQVVGPLNSGMRDFIPDKHFYSISSELTPCYDAVDTLKSLYTSHDYWFEPSFNSIMRAMRMAVVDRSFVKKEEISKHAEKFSIENVGQIIKKELENATKYSK